GREDSKLLAHLHDSVAGRHGVSNEPAFRRLSNRVGYSPATAASVVSMSLLMTTAGALIGAPMADRAGARRAMTITNVLGAAGFSGLMTASPRPGMILCIVAGGFAGGAGGEQMPLVIIESLGVKRLGSLLGVTGIFFTLGAAVAPIIAGHIFDVTGSY